MARDGIAIPHQRTPEKRRQLFRGSVELSWGCDKLWRMGLALVPLVAAFLVVVVLCYMTDRGFSDRSFIRVAAVGIGLELAAVMWSAVTGA